jgi:predicted house-cleaning noncanonical NTP pyrophosphatase (MazG superfamily)
MTESQFSQIIKDFNNLESSAINRVVVREDIVEIMYNSSQNVYTYTLNCENYANTIQECLDSKESLGKLINNSIKQQDLELKSKFLP